MTQINNTSFLGNLSMPADDPQAKTIINIDGVSMVFNIASEHLNSLKEYAIALSRRELRFKEFYALDNVSFEVKQGDVFGILGTNGSGKSTLLKIIAGVLEPTRGLCKVDGNIAPLIELGAGFDLELTARENIFLNGALLGYSKKFIQQHFNEIVDFAEVRDFLDMPMKNYSSGMVARIAFAIATVIIPDILIVDEVLSVGDFMFQQKCERRIQELIKEHGVTVLIVSHNNAQIERLCNKAVWIEKGHLRAIGSAKEVSSVYRAVGGRSGSAHSESVILSVLANCQINSTPKSPSLAGENRYGTAEQLATFPGIEPSIVFLTNSDSKHCGYLANSLSGLCGGIILTTASDFLPDATSQALRHLQPRNIVLVGDSLEIDNQVSLSIQNCCPRSHIARIEDKGEPFGIDTYRYGEHVTSETGRTWPSCIAFVAESCDAELVTLSPYFFRNAIPLFFISGSSELPVQAKEAISQAREVLVLADMKMLPNDSIFQVNPAASIIRFEPDEDIFKANRDINRWLANRRSSDESSDTYVITSPQGTIDNYCAGPLAGRLNAAILFTDPLSLDSIANSLEELKSNKNVKQLVFIGNDLRFGKMDKLMFESVLSQ